MPNTDSRTAVISFYRSGCPVDSSTRDELPIVFPLEDLRFDFLAQVRMPFDGNRASMLKRRETGMRTRISSMRRIMFDADGKKVRQVRFPVFYVLASFSQLSFNKRGLSGFLLDSAARGVRFAHPQICPAVITNGKVLAIEHKQSTIHITVMTENGETHSYNYDPNCNYLHVRRGQEVQEGEVMASFVPDGRFNSVEDFMRATEDNTAWDKHVRLVMHSTAKTFQGRTAYRLEFVDPHEIVDTTILCSLVGVPLYQKFTYTDLSELIYRFPGHQFDFLSSFWQKFRRQSAAVDWVRFLHGVGALFPNGSVQIGGQMSNPWQPGTSLTRYDRYAGTNGEEVRSEEIRTTSSIDMQVDRVESVV